MTEQRFRQRTEEETRDYLAKWESLFLGMVSASTKSGLSFYEFEPLIHFDGPEGKFTIAPIASLVDRDFNPRIIILNVYRDNHIVQKAMALATWENGRPTVRQGDIDQRTTLGFEQYSFDQLVDIAALALNSSEMPSATHEN